ncbi:MAG: NAD+ synthase [Bacteroidetes bacterium CG23_combo_of_CG06-09_8_20_14_all_32_9]|nr:MAG: NAD+ synthase [Bacteroidetes bacterium CG23_combo_of_CG06-09_8_20_14_all_32_9]
MQIALCQLNFKIADFEGNTTKIISAIKQAKSKNAVLAVFSEFAVCGYPPLDMLENKDFIDKCEKAVNQISEHCHQIAAIIGTPVINTNESGKKLFNSAVFIEKGKVKSIHCKSLLPSYDVFDEYRYFEPNKLWQIADYKNERIAITICEDLWVNQPVENSFTRQKLYTCSPMDELLKFSPTLMINIASSPFSFNHSGSRKTVLCENAKKYKLPLIYVNQVGANTELIFDGGSMAINATGKVFSELPYFEESVRLIDTSTTSAEIQKNEMPAIEKIYKAIILGIHDYFNKTGFNKAVLGLSGGIDSALVLVLAVKALGKENVHALLMPSRYSSQHSVTDALMLTSNLGVTYDLISIEPAFTNFETSLVPIFAGKATDITEENIQARIRGTLLMAYSNKFGNILLNTSNKSEMAVGYGTLYGDMAGGLSVIGDLYKTQVYQLANYINSHGEIIPRNIIIKAPSAELRPNQKDSDSLPKYDILDKILFAYIEQKTPLEEIVELGFDKQVVEKVIRLVNANEYKRFQTAPVLRISSKAFGFGRRMPLVAKY